MPLIFQSFNSSIIKGKYYICDYMNNFWYNIGKSLLRLFQRLPLGFHYAMGAAFAWVAEYVLKYRRDVIVTNIARSFPDRKYDDIVKIKSLSYKHIGEIFAEAMWFGGCSAKPERLRTHRIMTVDEEGAWALIKAFEERPSVMVFNSHLGNWELTGAVFDYLDMLDKEQLAAFKNSTVVVYKRLANKFWNRFISENRQANLGNDFNGYVESDDVVRTAFRNKDSRRIYVFPTDQYPYGGAASYDVESFMNQPTKTMAGGAALAHKFGMAVFETCFIRERRGSYRIVFEKICDDASLIAPKEIMSKYYSILEKHINNDPGNYLWSHKRWK